MKTSPRHLQYALGAFLTALLLASPAVAATPEDKTPLNLDTAEPVKQAADGSGGGGIVRMIVGLAVVIGVIYGLSWVLKQVKASKEGQATGAGLAAISSLPLGPNRSVHLVRVGTDLVLLGAAEKGVTPIRQFSDDEARAVGLLSDDEDAPSLEPQRPPAVQAAGSLVEALRRRTVRR